MVEALCENLEPGTLQWFVANCQLLYVPMCLSSSHAAGQASQSFRYFHRGTVTDQIAVTFLLEFDAFNQCDFRKQDIRIAKAYWRNDWSFSFNQKAGVQRRFKDRWGGGEEAEEMWAGFCKI